METIFKTFCVFTLVLAFAANLFGQTPAPSTKPAPAPAPTSGTTASAGKSVDSTTTSTMSAMSADGTVTGSTAAASSGLPVQFGQVYNGSYSYSYPIEVPAGTNGMTPGISLEYNSSLPNDIAGVGFRIGGLSTISRNILAGVHYDVTDQYLLDYQKLYYNSQDSAFHPERESYDVIQAFSTSAPTTPIQNLNSSTSYWVVSKKDGTKLYYGQTTDSRIMAVGTSPSVPRLWALNKVIDPQGNYYTITYTQDSVNGDYYPLKIVYTQNANNNPSLFKAILFTYEGRTDHSPQYLPTKVETDYYLRWISVLVGTDSSGNGGTLVRKYQIAYETGTSSQKSRIKTIQKYGNDGTWPAAGMPGTYSASETPLPPVTFNWQEGAGQFKTPELQANLSGFYNLGSYNSTDQSMMLHCYRIDINGDGRLDLVFLDTKNGVWKIVMANALGGFDLPVQDHNLDGFLNLSAVASSDLVYYMNIYPADVDGDGKTDLVVLDAKNGIWKILKSTGTDLAAPVQENNLNGFYNLTGLSNVASYLNIYPADINGDGRTDLVTVDAQSGIWKILFGNGTGLNAPYTETNLTGFYQLGGSNLKFYMNIYPVDVNGDGKTDLVVLDAQNGYWRILFANGTGLNAPYTESNLTGLYQLGGTNNLQYYLNIYPTDVNGDGKTDLVVLDAQNGVWRILFSNGKGFNAAYIETNLSTLYQLGGVSAANLPYYLNIFPVDVNGDGRTDLVVLDAQNGLWRILFSNGKGFNSAYTDPNLTGFYQLGAMPTTQLALYLNIYPIDIKADSKINLVTLDAQSGVWKILRPNAPVTTTPDLINKVTLPTQGTVSITYTPAGQVSGAVDSTGLSYPDIADIRPRPLVTQLVTDNNLGETTTTNYGYLKGKYRTGLDWSDLSFAKVTTNDGKTLTTTTYNQTWTYQGLVTDQLVQDTTGTNKYAETVYTYNTAAQIGTTKSYFVSLQSQMNKSFDGQATSTNTQTSYTYDQWGNVTTINNSGFVNDAGVETPANQYATTKTTLTYAKAATGNLFRLATKQTQAYDVNNNFVTTSQTQYYYDGNSTTGIVSAGLLTKVENNIDATTKATTTMTYDSWGNVLTVKDPRVNAGEYTGNTMAIVYDTTYHSLVTSTTNALNYTTSTTYETHLWPDTGTDANNQVTQWAYDSFGRTTKIAAPLDDLTSPTTTISYTDAVAAPFSPASVSTYQKTTGANTVRSISYYDGLGRTFQTKNQNVGTNWTTADVYFDAQGRVFKEGVPYLTNTASYTVRDTNQKVTQLQFDPMGRVTLTTHPDTTTSQTQYTQTKVTSIDENLHVSVTEVDTSNPRSVFKKTYTGTYPNQALYATNTLKTFANSTQMLDNSGNVTTSTTDWLGRKLQYSDPDLGAWNYSHDRNGNIITQVDAKNQTLTLTYDKLNRILTKSGTGINETFTYDAGTNGKGHLSGTTYNRGSDTLTYDARGRVVSTTRVLDGISKTESNTFDSMNRLVTETYPDAEGVTSNYGNDARLLSLVGTNTYISNLLYNPMGKVTSQLYGNGITTTYSYYDDGTNDTNTGLNHSLRLKQILAGTSGSVLNLTYTYEKNDNVHSRVDANNASNSETYGYDELDRLVSANSTVNGNLTFSFDKLNNLTQKDNLSYSYYATHPHQVQSFGSFNYSFDANGSMITRSDGRTIAYDLENRVISISDGGSYSYDTGRQRTIKTEGTKTTYYFFPDYQEEYVSGSLNNTIKYYNANGQKIAQRSTSQSLQFIHSDHLNSSTVMTDSSGTVVRRQGYKPFGSDAYTIGTATTKYQFTGQEKEINNLYYYNARYYDPDLGEFIQVDPAHQGQNPFAYCLNNPIKLNDPTGMDAVSADAAAFYSGMQAASPREVTQVAQNRSLVFGYSATAMAQSSSSQAQSQTSGFDLGGFLAHAISNALSTNPMNSSPAGMYTQALGDGATNVANNLAETSKVALAVDFAPLAPVMAAALPDLVASVPEVISELQISAPTFPSAILKGAAWGAGLNLLAQTPGVAFGGKQYDLGSVALAGGFGAITGPLSQEAVAAVNAAIQGAMSDTGSFITSQIFGRLMTSPLTVASVLGKEAISETGKTGQGGDEGSQASTRSAGDSYHEGECHS